MSLTLALVLPIAACGDSGSTGGTTTTATTTDATVATDTTTTSTATDSATGTDATAETDAGPTCSRSGFHPAGEQFVLNEIETLLYGWQTGDRVDGSGLSVILRERDGVLPPTTTGTYTLGEPAAEQSLTTCRTCVSAVTECASETGCKAFLATSGTLEVTALSISGRHIAGRLTDVRLRELDASGAPLADGRTWCLDALAFDTTPECTSDADCAAREGAPHCVTGWGKCFGCADDFDCDVAAAPLCRVDPADGDLACGALAADCNSADPGEPDDGPAVARLVTPGAPLEASICATADAVDWYRFALDDDTNVTPKVTWQGQGYLTLGVFSEAGELLADFSWYQLVEGKNVAGDLVSALPAGTYYLAVRMMAGVTFTVSYTLALETEPACATHADCEDGWCAAGECRPKAACDVPLPAIIHQRFFQFGPNFHYWRGETAFDGTGSFLILTLSGATPDEDPVPDVPGTYPLGDELNPRTCKRCMQVYRCNAAGCTLYFAVDGALEVETWDPAVPVFTGRLVDLKLVELDGLSVVPDGGVACADEVVIDTRPVCERDEDCDSGRCLLTYGGTGACVDCREHADCSGERDLCSPATLGCVECLTSLDCRTEPVCVAGTCSVVEECVGDDGAEPLDDGRLGARSLGLDAPLDGKLCGLAGTVSELEADWFEHAATGVGLRDFAVRWQGAGTITAVLYDPNGIEVARETSSTGATIVRRSLTPGAWLLEVKTLDVSPDATLGYTVQVTRP
ncbi:MAG: hypothetical protein IT385_28145 [Deltaproteobacteria bacterium]|nr:hypothetical protein [Deltaproteobacteria bacterium]